MTDEIISSSELLASLYAFSISLIVGFAIAKFLTGKTPQIKIYIFHIHHWIWATTILILLFFWDQTEAWMIGLVTGVAIEGLTYDDWSIFIKKEE
ncbi:MAG: hypothetical protein CMB48_04510 [Euryarchaeota archaeon]|nr:hypothetical protein [Euryarchaeota archaeon]|tara:strand:- start:850 stop:1134 length:285 start_codon:yes stop_codon:yes gene_type:complete